MREDILKDWIEHIARRVKVAILAGDHVEVYYETRKAAYYGLLLLGEDDIAEGRARYSLPDYTGTRDDQHAESLHERFTS